MWRSRHGYRGDGAFGQYMVVLPEQQAVIALFSCTAAMQEVLDLMWTHLLPAMTARPAANTALDLALSKRLSDLRLPTASERLGGAVPRAADGVSRTGHPAGPSLSSSPSLLASPDLPASLSPSALSFAICATDLSNGHTALDLGLLSTPHRLEIVLDRTNGTFATRWPITPIFAAGIGKRLTDMRPPAASEGSSKD